MTEYSVDGIADELKALKVNAGNRREAVDTWFALRRLQHQMSNLLNALDDLDQAVAKDALHHAEVQLARAMEEADTMPDGTAEVGGTRVAPTDAQYPLIHYRLDMARQLYLLITRKAGAT